MPSAAAPLIEELRALLTIKERLLRTSLEEGTLLSRDDSEFLANFARAEAVVAACSEAALKAQGRRILGHLRQFNPFNSSDVDENDALAVVVEDFVNFSKHQIDKLGN